MAGERPSIWSTSGFSIIDKNWRAYVDSDSTYLLWPSAYKVSKANDDFPDPESPVITIILFLGISRLTFLRLCVRAPFIKILSIRFKLSVMKKLI